MHGISVANTGALNRALNRARGQATGHPVSRQRGWVMVHTDGEGHGSTHGSTHVQIPAQTQAQIQAQTQANNDAGARRRVRRQHMVRPGANRQNQTGAAVIEFALILPVLLVLLIGSVDVSLALYDKAVITNASREGARAGIVARNPKLTEAEIRQVVRDQTDLALIHFGPIKPVPNVSVVQSTMGVDANTLDVTVSYTFEGIGLGTLFQALGQPWVLTSNTVMVHE